MFWPQLWKLSPLHWHKFSALSVTIDIGGMCEGLLVKTRCFGSTLSLTELLWVCTEIQIYQYLPHSFEISCFSKHCLCFVLYFFSYQTLKIKVNYHHISTRQNPQINYNLHILKKKINWKKMRKAKQKTDKNFRVTME